LTFAGTCWASIVVIYTVWAPVIIYIFRLSGGGPLPLPATLVAFLICHASKDRRISGYTYIHLYVYIIVCVCTRICCRRLGFKLPLRASSLGVSIPVNQVHPRRAMGKTKYAAVSGTIGQSPQAQQQSPGRMPQVPKAGFCIRPG
jgi:hypothetical protein